MHIRIAALLVLAFVAGFSGVMLLDHGESTPPAPVAQMPTEMPEPVQAAKPSSTADPASDPIQRKLDAAEREPAEPGVAVSAVDHDEPTVEAPPPVGPSADSGPEPMAASPGKDVAVVVPAKPEPVAVPHPNDALETMIGQMLIFGFQGSSPDQKWPQAVARQLEAGTIGGVIFLGYNLKSRNDARRLIRSFADAGRKARYPPLIVLDQEGGRVQRLGPTVGVAKRPSAKSIAGRGLSEQAARELYSDMARELRSWGFNVNLGPVVDVDVNPANPIIGKFGRSYSNDAATVTKYARAFVEAHRQQGILTALKHFPGHGSSAGDSHLGFVDISRTWQSYELEPYKKLLKSGLADMVMIGHLYHQRYSDLPANASEQGLPGSLSSVLIEGLLRGQLGYDGVVISDDMEMGAIRKHYKTRDALVWAIKAGTDLLIISNSAKPKMDRPELYVEMLAHAAEKDPELRRRIEQSYRRILKLKKRLRPSRAASGGRERPL